MRLHYLGYGVEPLSPSCWKVSPPSWRWWNVQTEGAVIEDWIRTAGINQLSLVLPPLDPTPVHPSVQEELLDHIEHTFLGHGFFEVISKSYYSSESAKVLQELDPSLHDAHISIKNSIDKENAYLKVMNGIHLAKACDYNLRKGLVSVKMYEVGRLFRKGLSASTTSYPLEQDIFSFAVSGRWNENEWKKGDSAEEKLYLFKGVIEALVERLKRKSSFSKSAISFLHPGCQASILVEGKEVGFFGLLHPQIRARLDLLDDVVYGELNAEAMTSILLQKKEREILSEYPSIKRDATLQIPLDGYANIVCDQMFSLRPENLCAVTIKDSFKKPEEPFRRVTYRLHFQSASRTLSHEEVDRAMATLLNELEEKFHLQRA